jgi:hypothetical protein
MVGEVFYDAGLPFVFDGKLRFLHRSRVSRVDALSLKSGPTQSGVAPQPPPLHPPVGGEMFAADKLSVFMSNYWLAVILLLLLPLAVLFYKKRELALRLLAPLLLRL